MFNGMNGLEILNSWPRYEDGELVPIGGEFMGKDGKTYTAKQIQFIGKCFSLFDFCDRKPQFSGFYGERVKRPAPKVLDADGVEIRMGETVYLLPGDWCDKFPCLGYHGGEELAVFSLHANHVEGGIGCRDTRRPKGTCYPQPSQLTHRAPVLAADGEPLLDGDEVWRVKGGGGPYHVQEVRDGVSVCVGETHCEFRPDELTHERPDSWERLEEDAGCTAAKYNERSGTIFTTKQQVARDLVRRCRALAERERGE